MKLNELNHDQICELKQRYLMDHESDRDGCTSWSELANADELVTMDELTAEYGCTNFVPEDFCCTTDPDEPTDHTPDRNEPQTDFVCFRKFDDGEIIALFPEQIADVIRYTCGSYMHNGQHSDASTDLLHSLPTATPEEYAPLAEELRQIGYNLEIEKPTTMEDVQRGQKFWMYQRGRMSLFVMDCYPQDIGRKNSYLEYMNARTGKGWYTYAKNMPVQIARATA